MLFRSRAYKRTRLIWAAAVVADLGIQASRTADSPASKLASLLRLELYFTIAFDVEILLRVVASLPDWRSLWFGRENIADITLAVVTSLLQIPIIRDSNAYPWLTIFQLARFYRVILAIPRTRRLLVSYNVWSTGLLPLTLPFVRFALPGLSPPSSTWSFSYLR